MTVLLGVSMGARTVRMAQPRTDRVDPNMPIDGAPRPLFFRNEAIDTADHDVEHLAAESIGVATRSDPQTSTGVAYRDARQADALHQAMESRHVQNYHLVPEVEAVIAYLAATGEAAGRENVALFDLGSSGLTVSVVDLVDRTVIASRRTTEFSGDQYDDILRDNQLDRLGKSADAPDIDLFSKRCRVAKERLSSNDAVCLPDESGMILISRDSFELLIGHDVDEAIEWARGVLVDAHAPIDAVVLIGGCARIPLVRDRVGPSLELPTITPTEPETVSARGAALFARPAFGESALQVIPTRPAGPAPGASSASLGSWVSAPESAPEPEAPQTRPIPAPPRPVPAVRAPEVAVAPADSEVHAPPTALLPKPVQAPAAEAVVPGPPAAATAALVAEPIVAKPRVAVPAAETPTVVDSSVVDSSVGDSDKPVPFQLKNVYWLDADYEDDDGDDDRTIRRRRVRTGGISGFIVVAAAAVSAFFVTQQGGNDVVPASVTQSDLPAATTTVAPAPATTLPPAAVLPPPPAPVTTVPEEPVAVPEPEVVRQAPVTTTVTTPPSVEVVTPVQPPVVATPPPPPPLIPGLPDFTFPPLFPPAP